MANSESWAELGASMNAPAKFEAMANTWGLPNAQNKIYGHITFACYDNCFSIVDYDFDTDGLWYIMEGVMQSEYFKKLRVDGTINKWEGYCKVFKNGNVFFSGKTKSVKIKELF